MTQYRVTRDSNRYAYDATRYFETDDIVTVEDITDRDSDGEVVAAGKTLMGGSSGWILPDALVPVNGFDSSPIDVKVLSAALALHDVSSIQPAVLAEVIDTYNKIKEALA